jgi:protein-S-isoprenylcysteine O-methyltransferase Ste14
MALRDQFVHSGRWLFLWRSYLPLFLLVLLILPLANFDYLGGSHALDQVWDLFCIGISVLGLLVRAKTIGHTPTGTSGRNTHDQVAHSLNTTGMYSIVRHPLYLGNYLMWLGLVLFAHNFLIVIIVTLAFVIYYERIMFAEEDFLRSQFGAEFEAWAAATPAFWPAVWRWRAPSLPFSLRNVLKREYSGLYALVVLFTLMEFTGEYMAEGDATLDPGWIAFLLIGTVFYLVLRTLKKHTRLLHVPGR